MEFRISVRGLVEFVLRTGDIDNRRRAASDQAMAEGGRIHRMIQKRMGSEYQAEVPLSYRYETDDYHIVLDGRADGIIAGEVPVIDEIKGTYRHLEKMTGPNPVHMAQAKCYAYMYAKPLGLEKIRVRITYCNMETEDIRYFQEEQDFFKLEKWFLDVMEQYKKWTDFEYSWKQKRQSSIKALEFPFPYREGQKQLVTYVYQTIVHQRKLFLEAPTGVGKTISTMFPAIKAIGENKADRLFYLTAKTITGTVADETLELLREKGLSFKSCFITAKEKVCKMEECNCNPEYCPYAKGHFDRINDAMYDLLTHANHFGRDEIDEYATKHQVCPFEFCLDMSLFADGIICDYNYLFDPHVYLKRFFAEGKKGEYLFLIDEVHNLVERGRDMYSAILRKEDILALKKTIKGYDKKIEKRLDKCNKMLLEWKRDYPGVHVHESIHSMIPDLERLYSAIEEYLENHETSPVREDILEFYFMLSHFLMIFEKTDEKYVVYSYFESDGAFCIKLFCVDPSVNLRECLDRGKSATLFSATLLPIQYYKQLLGGTEEDYEVYAHSTFPTENREIIIGNDVTSKYTRRSELEYRQIAKYIYTVAKQVQGNYMVFFPSHAFLKEVYEAFTYMYAEDSSIECMIQGDYMKEEEREAFLKHFTGNKEVDFSDAICMDVEIEDEKGLIGFCVMGGIFGEGIDLKKESLIGAIIVGTGIPQVCTERELIKNYFDKEDGKGYDYAYLYPGMNKVLQASGRVIRTHEDKGIILLLDERFLYSSYQKLFPREWSNHKVVSLDTVSKCVEDFWKRAEDRLT